MGRGDEVLPAPPAGWLALHDAAAGGDVLRDGPRRRRTRLDLGGGLVVTAKEWRAGPLRALAWRLAAAFGRGPAARALRSIARLRAAGLPAPEALAVAGAGGAREVLFTRWVEGPTLGEAVAAAAEAGDVAGRRALAVLAADFAARLQAAGLAVRDLKPPNLVVVTGGGQAPGLVAGASGGWSGVDLVLVDLDDVRARGAARYAVRNLAALDAYAQRGPAPPRVGDRLAALRAWSVRLGRDPRAWLRPVLTASRARRAKRGGSTASLRTAET